MLSVASKLFFDMLGGQPPSLASAGQGGQLSVVSGRAAER
jgi:hypothetical protein